MNAVEKTNRFRNLDEVKAYLISKSQETGKAYSFLTLYDLTYIYEAPTVRGLPMECYESTKRHSGNLGWCAVKGEASGFPAKKVEKFEYAEMQAAYFAGGVRD